jgi:3-hydroxymyristoyl/3-hydroxydecanoyl-(acyl carrier protein) dehydratase
MTAMPLTIAADHPAFAGHFPAQPIVPGVVLLDLGMRAIAQHSGPGTSTRYRVGNAKFLSPVGPGEALRITFEPSAVTADGYRLQIHAGPPDDERLAVSGDVAFESRDSDEAR